MDIDSMKNFIEICNNGYNVTKTSQKINITQPALSKMISQMECEFKSEIFLRRKGKFVGLTEAGKIIYNRFQEIVNIYNILFLQVQEIKEGISKHIKIGISPKVLEILIKDDIYKLYEDNDIVIEFVENDINSLIKSFTEDKLDILLILSIDQLDSSKYYSNRIASSEYVTIMNKSHRLAYKDKIRWRDLENMKIAIPTKGSQTYDMIMDKINNERINPKHIFTVSSDKILLELPAKDDIITILPENFYDEYNSDSNIIIKRFEKSEYWNVDMYISNEDRQINSKVYYTFNKLMEIIDKDKERKN
ncbi:MAG: LysR family transcriptional regulator [Peptoniphilaceae bacterium]|nr:LysR family transcriptional regulator [Peptoniphilaceae bacterium]MDY6019535.1 LysR family transcriptional regulator [Anaerococcus sp.]